MEKTQTGETHEYRKSTIRGDSEPNRCLLRLNVRGINNLAHTPPNVLAVKAPTGIFSLEIKPSEDDDQVVNIESDGLTLLNSEVEPFINNVLAPPQSTKKPKRWYWYFEKKPADIQGAERLYFELSIPAEQLIEWVERLTEKLSTLPIEQLR